MSKRVNQQLWETGQGKYVADLGFTFAEVTELMRVLTKSVKEIRLEKRDKSLPAKKRKLAGYREDIIERSLSYLYEAHALLKTATNTRKQGRYEAERDRSASENVGRTPDHLVS